MGIMYLSASLRAHHHDVRLQIAHPSRLGSLRRTMTDYRPQVVAFSSMSGEYGRFLQLNSRLKTTFSFLSVFGGPHVTFHPGCIEDDGVDAICIGEGELAFVDFCRRYENDLDYWNTPNFVVEHDGSVYENPLMPLVANLDDLPFPDREIMYRADSGLRQDGFKLFFASRGCPFHCSYCFNQSYNRLYKGLGPYVRHRSPENVVEEICRVKRNYPLDIVYLDDDVFLIKPEGWIDSFCDLYASRVALPLTCHVRADLVTEDIVRRLKSAGLFAVWMGVECGNESLSNHVLKRRLSNEQILSAAKILHQHGIEFGTQNLLGLPVDDSYSIDLETLDLNIAIKPTFGWSSILFPYPGTEIESYAVDRGFLDPSFRSFPETNKRSSVFDFNSRAEKRKIENLHKLFGIIVRFPGMRRFADLLASLPLTDFYTVLYYLWYGYNVKIKMYPVRSYRRDLWRYLRFFLSFARKS